jgi:hypothetical protein
MKKVIIVVLATLIFSGCVTPPPPPENVISNSLGHYFESSDVGFSTSITDLGSNGGSVYLPPYEIPIDIMFYINHVDNLNIIGSSWNTQKTTLNFVNHTVWYDPSTSIKGFRAVIPGTTNPAPRTADFSMKAMDFVHCKNLYLYNIVFTGAAATRFIVEENSNLHLKNIDWINIDRWFTHHTDYGSWVSTCAIESDSTTLLASDILVENCNIHCTTNFGFVPFMHSVNATFQNVTFRNCTAFRCGMPIGNVYIVDYYNIDGTLVRENNNWQNWSIGFGLLENYYWYYQLTPTSRDWTFDHCKSEENRESGFHSEYRVIKDNIHYINCVSNRNGQKWLSQGYDYGYNPPIETYSSGFLDIPDARYDVTMVNCVANDNFKYGYWGINSGGVEYETQMTNCTSSGNGLGNT